ncbi:putative alpha crystallin/Hsp20 domain, HSP20-like chaperone [Helianthus debilis subsp. tardiflorus]
MNPQGVTEFEPSIEWVNEDDCDTLLLYLPGFAKEQLKVQLRSRTLILSGQRKVNDNTWTRFRKEFPLAENCDISKISAKFEGNILNIRLPKTRTPVAKLEEKTPTNAPTPTPDNVNPTDEPKMHQEQAKVKPDSKAEGSKNDVEEKDENYEGRVDEFKDSKGVRENVSKKTTMKPNLSRNDVMKVVALVFGFVVGLYCSKLIQSWIA